MRRNRPYRGPLVKRGKTVVGKGYRPTCGCPALPWIACGCSDAGEWEALESELTPSERLNEEADARLELALVDA